MRKKNSKTKTKIEDTADLEVPLNTIIVKLQNICLPIENIQGVPVRFVWVSQHDKQFSVHFKSASKEEYALYFDVNDVIIKSSEELTEDILKKSKVLEKIDHID